MSGTKASVLERILNVARTMDSYAFRESDYSTARERLERELNRLSTRGSQPKIRKAPLYASDTKERLPALPGFLITKDILKEYRGFDVSITHYDASMIPRYRRGILTDAYPAYARIESLSGRAWYFQYSRIIRIEVFEGHRMVKTIWHDLHID